MRHSAIRIDCVLDTLVDAQLFGGRLQTFFNGLVADVRGSSTQVHPSQRISFKLGNQTTHERRSRTSDQGSIHASLILQSVLLFLSQIGAISQGSLNFLSSLCTCSTSALNTNGPHGSRCLRETTQSTDTLAHRADTGHRTNTLSNARKQCLRIRSTYRHGIQHVLADALQRSHSALIAFVECLSCIPLGQMQSVVHDRTAIIERLRLDALGILVEVAQQRSHATGIFCAEGGQSQCSSVATKVHNSRANVIHGVIDCTQYAAFACRLTIDFIASRGHPLSHLCVGIQTVFESPLDRRQIDQIRFDLGCTLGTIASLTDQRGITVIRRRSRRHLLLLLRRRQGNFCLLALVRVVRVVVQKGLQFVCHFCART